MNQSREIRARLSLDLQPTLGPVLEFSLPLDRDISMPLTHGHTAFPTQPTCPPWQSLQCGPPRVVSVVHKEKKIRSKYIW